MGGIGVVRAFLMCTCARNAALYFSGLALGCRAAGFSSSTVLAMGVVYCFVLSTFVEGANRLSDRVEDEVNRPERTYLCALVGFDRLRTATVACGIYAVLHAGVWVALRPSIWLAAFLAGTIVVAAGYSFVPGRPSLKRRRLLSPVLLTTPTLGLFLVGFFARPGQGLEALFGRPLAFLVAAFLILAVIGGAKDVTDVAGDMLIGYRSAWIDAAGSHRASVLAAAALPSAAVVVLAAAGALPVVVLLAAPVVFAAVAYLGFRGRATIDAGGAGGLTLRSISSHLQLCLVALVGLLSFWSPGLAALEAGVVVYWFVTDRWLYWSRFELPVGAASGDERPA